VDRPSEPSAFTTVMLFWSTGTSWTVIDRSPARVSRSAARVHTPSRLFAATKRPNHL